VFEQIREDAGSTGRRWGPRPAQPGADFTLIAQQTLHPAVGTVGRIPRSRLLPCRQHVALQPRPREKEARQSRCRHTVARDHSTEQNTKSPAATRMTLATGTAPKAHPAQHPGLIAECSTIVQSAHLLAINAGESLHVLFQHAQLGLGIYKTTRTLIQELNTNSN